MRKQKAQISDWVVNTRSTKVAHVSNGGLKSKEMVMSNDFVSEISCNYGKAFYDEIVYVISITIGSLSLEKVVIATIHNKCE